MSEATSRKMLVAAPAFEPCVGLRYSGKLGLWLMNELELFEKGMLKGERKLLIEFMLSTGAIDMFLNI
jgi:hypothetical protein